MRPTLDEPESAMTSATATATARIAIRRGTLTVSSKPERTCWVNRHPGTIAPVDFETRAIHVGQEPDPATGAVIVPIYQTSTYVQESVGVLKDGYDYSRTANPTRRALETCLASLEGAAARLRVRVRHGGDHDDPPPARPGRHGSSAVNDVYGGTYRLFTKVYEPRGTRLRVRRPADAPLAGALDERTRMLWVESPTNPMLKIVDIARRRRGSATPPARSSSSTTRSRRRFSSGRSSSAPTSSSTRRRSTSAATPTSSAASRSTNDAGARRAARVPPELARRRARPARLRGSSCAG